MKLETKKVFKVKLSYREVLDIITEYMRDNENKDVELDNMRDSVVYGTDDYWKDDADFIEIEYKLK